MNTKLSGSMLVILLVINHVKLKRTPPLSEMPSFHENFFNVWSECGCFIVFTVFLLLLSRTWKTFDKMIISLCKLTIKYTNENYSFCTWTWNSISAIISTVRAHSCSNLFSVYILFRPTAKQANNNKNKNIPIWKVLPRVDIRLKKRHQITARTILGLLLKRQFSLNYCTADFGRIWDILSDRLFIESE